ncbi:MAG TPA: Crp/Fnr family transcriptional regulator [Pyrinomonadaceae bacterium]
MLRPHGSESPMDNDILNALPRQHYPLLFSELELVKLSRGKIIYHLAEQISFAFFIMSGAVSLLSITQDGSTIQIAMVGSEGVLGIPAMRGINKPPYQVMVQIPVRAMRVRTDVLFSEFNRDGPLRDMILRYEQALIWQISQSAACNRFHTVEERLCRWLLTSRDRIKANDVQLTQEALSHMLGATRPNVTDAAIHLRIAGLIDYHHGNIRILDHVKLESAACECYRTLADAISSLHVACDKSYR